MINKSLMAVMVITLAHLPIKSALALGPNGHRMVAKIAEDNSSAMKVVNDISAMTAVDASSAMTALDDISR